MLLQIPRKDRLVVSCVCCLLEHLAAVVITKMETGSDVPGTLRSLQVRLCVPKMGS